MMEECPICGYEPKKFGYFNYINKLKQIFETKHGEHPTHLLVDPEMALNLECSDDLIDRLIRIKDTTQGVLGTALLGLRVIKTNDIKGMKVALL